MDIYAEITNRIIAQMEDSIIPWEKPWIGSSNAVSHTTGKPYSLLNQMLLCEPGEYITYKQCIQAGGHVRKREKARMIVFWKPFETEDKKTGEKKLVPILRYYNVFHIDQCEGIAAKHILASCTPVAADETAEAIISSYLERSSVKLYHTGISRAFYRPTDDSISLPCRSQFKGLSEYYSTAFHELTHSTGHVSRLNRIDSTAHFGSSDYSKEELVSEIGSAALLSHTGLETAASFRNNAAYIQSWLQVLRNDKRFIISAAGKAEKAVSLILGKSDCQQKA